jgi:hypothetical protein
VADPLGVSVAFDDDWDTVTPTWTRLDTLTGCRVQGWQIDRGRNTEFEKTGTGTANVQIADRDGLFDPTNAFSPYANKLLPGKQAAIALQNPVTDEWSTMFRGFVESWSYRLETTRQVMFLDVQLVDAFALLSRFELRPGTDGNLPLPTGVPADNVFYENTLAGSVQTRINDILDDVGWPAGLADIFSGNVNLSEKTYGPGTSALAALQDAADGEFAGVANLYVSKGGIVTFHGRQPRFRPEVAEYGINERTVGDPSATLLDEDVVPVAELEWTVNSDQIVNMCLAYPEKVDDVQIDPDDVPGQLVTDSTSMAAYGPHFLSLDNLQTRDGIATGNDALEETLLVGDYYVDNYKDPAIRCRMTFKTRRPEDPNGPTWWNHVCKCEISDLLHLTTDHPGDGGFAAAVDQYFVEGLHYQAAPLGAGYPNITLTLDVSPRAHWDTNPFDEDPDP